MASAPISVSPRAVSAAPNWELNVRYAAAYACTLLAILAAWPRIATPFATLLVATTLVGLPLSLSLRRSGLRLGRFRISRPIFNAFVLATTMFTSATYLWISMRQITGGARWFDGNLNRGIELLIGVFLLFAVCRCLFILTDKDALLCTVPSFSVLLLLIVVQREATIVIYFLLWSLATAILLALDHRGESRLGLSGTVPAVVPGQEFTLPARSLGGVIAFSLACSSVLAYGLASTSSQSRSPGENWIIEMVSRWSNLAVDASEVSYGSSLSRRIDFSSGPALPSRRVVWRVRAASSDGKREFQPALWRSFTLSNYDGASWTASGSAGSGRASVPLSRFDVAQSTLLPPVRRRPIRLKGYNVRARQLETRAPANQFGTQGVRIRQLIVAQNPSTGFLPSLPAAEWVLFSGSAPSNIFAGDDASLETVAMQRSDEAIIESVVPPSVDYDTATRLPSAIRAPVSSSSVRLSRRERRANLQLPTLLPSRVRALPARILRASSPDESAFGQAQRLAAWVQNRASYTLRPPATPQNRDAADYFLFESRRGYCTYFAGALTVLCRAQGIPARVVAGYANPEWAQADATGTLFGGVTPGNPRGILREANGHAWTEIWQDGWGWTPVDATPADSRGNNAPGMLAETGDVVGSFLARAWRAIAGAVVWLWRHLLWLALLSSIAFVLLWLRMQQPNKTPNASFFGWLRRRTRSQTPLSRDEMARAAIQSDYTRAARELSRRFRRRAVGETSREWLHAAESALNLRDSQPLRRLTDLDERAGYGSRAMDENDQAEARHALRELSWDKAAQSRTQTAAA